MVLSVPFLYSCLFLSYFYATNGFTPLVPLGLSLLSGLSALSFFSSSDQANRGRAFWNLVSRPQNSRVSSDRANYNCSSSTNFTQAIPLLFRIQKQANKSIFRLIIIQEIKKYCFRDISTFGSTKFISQKFNILYLSECIDEIPDISFSCFPADIYHTDF